MIKFAIYFALCFVAWHLIGFFTDTRSFIPAFIATTACCVIYQWLYHK